MFDADSTLGMQTINGLKHVESSAMLQFLQPTLNMLLRMIGDGGETLQVLHEFLELPAVTCFSCRLFQLLTILLQANLFDICPSCL